MYATRLPSAAYTTKTSKYEHPLGLVDKPEFPKPQEVEATYSLANSARLECLPTRSESRFHQYWRNVNRTQEAQFERKEIAGGVWEDYSRSLPDGAGF